MLALEDETFRSEVLLNILVFGGDVGNAGEEAVSAVAGAVVNAQVVAAQKMVGGDLKDMHFGV